MHVDRSLVEALLRFRNSDLAPFVAHLKARLEKQRDSCTTLSGEALLRAQGRALELKELIETIESAPTLLDKMRNTP
jgi:hypothetical protein